MSTFSKLLTKFINQKNIRIYSLAEYCGIDSSLMYKIIHGKRNPSSFKIVNRIGEYLQLTPSEQQELSTSYAIDSQGYENFYRRKDILAFLNNFKNIANISSVNINSNMVHEYQTDLLPLHNIAEVNQAVLNIIIKQSEKKFGSIDMLMRTDYSFLINLLVAAAHQNSDIKIYHIICLNNTEQLTDHKSFNLHCLMDILPLCTCGCSYVPYYYYDNTLSMNTLKLFPYFILTEDQAVILSETLQYGFFTKQKDMLQLLKTLFNEYKTHTRMLLRKMNHIQEQIRYMENSLIQHSSSRYFLGMIPYITLLMTTELLKKYIHPEIAQNKDLIKELSAYIAHFYHNYKQNNVVIIFSENGIKTFLETGLIETYPEELYIPIETKDRISLMKRLLKEFQNTSNGIRMLRHDIGTVENGVNLYVTNQCGYLLFKPVGQHVPVWLDIHESGLLSAFLDFFEHMDEQLFYSHKEAISKIEQLLHISQIQ